MSDRLRARDLQIWSAESASTPMHNATLSIFEPGEDGFGHARILAIVADRIAYVPRYRQRLVAVPGRLANPVWVDDEEFDLSYHVRRSALPVPGGMDQLRELTSRIVSRPLDRQRPLWEVYVIEGLEGGRVAVLSKSHQVLVDGVETVDIGQMVLDSDVLKRPAAPDVWQPRREPSTAALLLAAVSANLESPRVMADSVRGNLEAARRLFGSGLESSLGRVQQVARAARPGRSVRQVPFVGELSQQRRVVTVATDLEVHRRIRAAHGTTLNDVVLATVTGALRGWLMTRDESLFGVRELRALVPMSVIDDDLEATSLGAQVVGLDVSLPVGEVSPVVRLLQVAYGLKGHREAGKAVGARRLSAISGFAPATFHALGSRLTFHESRGASHVAVTNVPGPQSPLYAAGARLVASYPLHPLLHGHGLSIGATSYDGHVFYGITADRDLVPDADLLALCLKEALDELLDTVTEARPLARRGQGGAPRAGDGTAGGKTGVPNPNRSIEEHT